MIVFIVIVLSSIFNLLSCATFHHIQPVHAIPKTTLKLRTYESLENYEFPELEDFDYNNDEAPFFPKENTLLEFLRKAFGKVARIHCIGAGYPPPNITWTKNNEEIVRHMGTVQYKKWAIILEDLTPKDAGDYTCKLCNIHGCIDHTTKLLVEDRFSSSLYFIKEQIVNGTATVNGNITFKCPVIQTERAAHIKWIKFHALNDSDAPPNAVLLEYLQNE
ncbi:fibroblast growth factor receptor 3-like isoform X2 [Contarinia nasturtii]|uniref:fibroblast growth factor receptor 3-like isoform X2 n=1 Tax=Contarinia nasturtii TaxID=265458 RepID=UPI0012D39BCC|nr:fibroblast growth factor receptor 3-like isoform X2 [Contarinia nasturtii]